MVGKFDDAQFSLYRGPEGYKITMTCAETAAHIHIALTGEILKSEEIFHPTKGDDESLEEKTSTVKPYTNADGLIRILAQEIEGSTK